MVLEVENIFRNIEDIRKALLSLRTKEVSDNMGWDIMILENMMANVEFKTRALEFELNNG